MNAWTTAVALALVACATVTEAAPCGEQDAAIRTAKLETWPGFYRTQDVAGLDAFLTDGFRSVAGDGQVTTKAQELTWVAKNPWRPRDFTYTITSIDCPAADNAIVIGIGRTVRTGGDGERTVHRYTSSNLFVRMGGRWRAAASHVSGEGIERASERPLRRS